MDHPNSSKRRQIESNCHKYRSLTQDITQEPLKGWQREIFIWESEFCGDSGIYIYKGDPQKPTYSHPNSWRMFYGYPVPVLDATRQHPLQLQTQFLFCTTSRAFILGVPKTPKKDGISSLNAWPRVAENEVRLQDPDGNNVGFITLMRKEDVERLAEKTAPGKLVELVAILEGWFGEDESSDEVKKIKNWAKEYPRRECYHVLWVEWEEGIAYRRGNGCVMKEAWEKLREKEPVDLILG